MIEPRLCECGCGQFTKVIYQTDAAVGATKGEYRRFVRGHHRRNRGAKITGTRTYQSWIQMRARCLRPSHHAYDSYGGRGITICERWDSFENFLADMGERPPDTSLDRIDTNGNYCPENCRWASPLVQQSNRRNARQITYDGRTQHVAAWAREFGISDPTLRARLDGGWEVHDALTVPAGKPQPARLSVPLQASGPGIPAG